jgi:hypothetical protein
VVRLAAVPTMVITIITIPRYNRDITESRANRFHPGGAAFWQLSRPPAQPTARKALSPCRGCDNDHFGRRQLALPKYPDPLDASAVTVSRGPVLRGLGWALAFVCSSRPSRGLGMAFRQGDRPSIAHWREIWRAIIGTLGFRFRKSESANSGRKSAVIGKCS